MRFDDTKPYCLVFGASIVDITGFCSVDYIPFNSNPGQVRISYGGVCRNIAENLSRVGVNTKFISIIGNDETGRGMVEHARQVGYCMEDSLVLRNHGTPTYMVILDQEGEMISAVVDMKGIEEADVPFIEAKSKHFEKAAFTFVDSDNPQLLEYLVKHFGHLTHFILDPVSSAKAANIRHLIGYFHTVKPNVHEAEVLVGYGIKTDEDLLRAASDLHRKGVQNVFISLGANGIFYSNGIERGRIKAQNVSAVNVTGAGDSFVAGLGYGYMNDLPIVDLVKRAIAMSVIAVSCADTINSKMCLAYVDDHIAALEWDIAYL